MFEGNDTDSNRLPPTGERGRHAGVWCNRASQAPAPDNPGAPRSCPGPVSHRAPWACGGYGRRVWMPPVRQLRTNWPSPTVVVRRVFVLFVLVLTRETAVGYGTFQEVAESRWTTTPPPHLGAPALTSAENPARQRPENQIAKAIQRRRSSFTTRGCTRLASYL